MIWWSIHHAPYMIISPEPWLPYPFWWVFVPSQNQNGQNLNGVSGRLW